MQKTLKLITYVAESRWSFLFKTDEYLLNSEVFKNSYVQYGLDVYWGFSA